MARRNEEFAVAADGLSGLELALGKNVLGAAGIPCVAHGPDFDMAELGRAAHDQIRGGMLLVPHAALELARAALEAAWGTEAERRGLVDDEAVAPDAALEETADGAADGAADESSRADGG